jgi:hypothetical protein
MLPLSKSVHVVRNRHTVNKESVMIVLYEIKKFTVLFIYLYNMCVCLVWCSGQIKEQYLSLSSMDVVKGDQRINNTDT